MNYHTKSIGEFINKSCNTILNLKNNIEDIENISECLSKVIIKGKKILACGNGGSAADAQHFAAEMLIRFRSDNERISLPAISLTQDPSTLTACANDYSFEEVYSRLVSSLGNKGDALLAISTSGESLNVLRAIEIAKKKELKIILLTGYKKTQMSELADFKIQVEDHNTARIQQAHITIIHSIMYLIESKLAEKKFL
tara:strand:- start:242 stop:835 length:594 start_codon:yes stop_codon:yes gene_type:complete